MYNVCTMYVYCRYAKIQHYVQMYVFNMDNVRMSVYCRYAQIKQYVQMYEFNMYNVRICILYEY